MSRFYFYTTTTFRETQLIITRNTVWMFSSVIMGTYAASSASLIPLITVKDVLLDTIAFISRAVSQLRIVKSIRSGRATHKQVGRCLLSLSPSVSDICNEKSLGSSGGECAQKAD